MIKYKKIMGAIMALVMLASMASCTITVPESGNRRSNASPATTQSSAQNTGNSGIVLEAETFIAAAQKAGYTIIIEDDYDGFNTYWAGAHKFAEDETVFKEGNEIYVIDYTKDATLHNARVEYNLYLDKVKEVGGKVVKDEGDEWQYQVNIGETQVAVTYRISDINMYCVAPVEYTDEILAFFAAMDFGIKVD